MVKICNKCGKKLSMFEGKNILEEENQLLLCDNCFYESKGKEVADKKSELFDSHKKRLTEDEESRMTKDLIINIKKPPNLDGLLEVTNMWQMVKLTQGYVRQYVLKYEDGKKLLYISPPFYYEKKKDIED